MPRTDPGLVPVFEELPAFEEEDLPPPQPALFERLLLDKRTPAGQQLRLLAARLRALGKDRRLRRLGVTSAGVGDGRSSVALGLAHALAEGHHRRVLLVEVDLLRPAVDERLAFAPPETGLRRYLADDSDGLVTVRRLGSTGLWILSAGRGRPAGLAALASPGLVPLLKSADRVFDYTVLDCPPLLPGPEVAALQDQTDGLVFVVRTRHTKREAVRQAARLLDPARLCGYVLNGQRSRGRLSARGSTTAGRRR